MAKTLSIVIPNYNDADHIAISLKAVCEQSYPPTEVIVIDDASTDNSIEVIQEIAAKYPYVRLVQNEVNRGVNYSANKGVSLARSDYLGFTSADDLFLPGAFERSMSLLEKYPEVGLSWSNSITLFLKDGTSYESSQLPLSAATHLTPKEIADIAARINTNCRFCPSGQGTIFKRDLISKTEPFLPELGPWADWFLGHVMVFRYSSCYLPEPVIMIRHRESGYSGGVQKSQQRYRQLCTALLRLLASPKYKDVTHFVIRSRSLRIMQPHARTPYAAYLSLQEVKTKESQALIHHLAMEYVLVDLTYPLRKLLRTTSISILHYLKNLYDRAFARSFHEYDKVRNAVKKRFVDG